MSLKKENSKNFREGVIAAMPVIAAAAPFGAVYGAAAVSKGLSIVDAILMSATVYAGASQMIALDLLATPIPFWTIVLSVLAVNFRHILYSASLSRRLSHYSGWKTVLAFFFLVDPQWALSEKRALNQPLTFSYYLGIALPLYLGWVGATWLGASFGSLITNPQQFGLDFILPIYFIALLMGFRERPNWLPIVLAASMGSLFAYKFIGAPWHVATGAAAGIILAIFIGKPDESTQHE